jgi:hypothetical protein
VLVVPLSSGVPSSVEGLMRPVYTHPALHISTTRDRVNMCYGRLYILLIGYCQQLTVGCDPAVFAAGLLLWVTALLVGGS